MEVDSTIPTSKPIGEACPLGEPTEFERAYIIQTRQEIDTEKKERDTLLNFAILIQGGSALVVVQSTQAWEFVRSPSGLGIVIPGLFGLTALMWVRYMKLRQIADRWVVLYRLLCKRLGEEIVRADYLEGKVCRALCTRRYLSKDLILNFALALPLYGLVLLYGFTVPLQPARVTASLFVLVTHAVLGVALLSRPTTLEKDLYLRESESGQ